MRTSQVAVNIYEQRGTPLKPYKNAFESLPVLLNVGTIVSGKRQPTKSMVSDVMLLTLSNAISTTLAEPHVYLPFQVQQSPYKFPRILEERAYIILR